MIVLYNPPSSVRRTPVLPMSLLAVGALLEGRTDYTIVDGNLVDDAFAAIDAALRGGAEVLAVTVMPGPQLADAVPLCRRVKAAHPHARVVWGGYFPTQHFDVCLQEPTVDVVVRGHGEHVFADLVERLERQQPLDDLPGLAFRRATGAVLTTGLPVMPHPQQLPEFPYHRVAMARYVRRSFMGSRTLSHHSSYGCPFTCNFCAVVNLAHGRWLAQDSERTAAVVHRLVGEFGANAVEFYDNNFFVDEGRVVDIAGRIEPLGIGWWGEGRIDTMLKFGHASWSALRRSGLRMVYLGAESGSDDTLRRMDKGGTASVEKTLAIAARTAEHGVVPEFSFVLGNPPDPEADVADTIRCIRRVKALNPDAEIVLYLYTPVPLSGDLYDGARASGFAFPTTLDEWIAPAWREFSQRRSDQLSWVDRGTRNRVRDFERVLHARFPTVTDPSLAGFRRLIPRVASAWRYRFGVYGYPVELRVLNRLWPHRRPETSGF